MKDQELEDILEELKMATTTSFAAGSVNLETNFDISPQDFLSYAEQDLSQDYNHKYVNSLSNSKRALDCQLDSLLLAFGYYHIAREKRWSFPKKLDFMKELGVIAPRILGKINRTRNLLEHHYQRPENEVVEDFLDITMMFIASTDKYTLKFRGWLNLHNEQLNKGYRMENNYKQSQIYIVVRDSARYQLNEETAILSEHSIPVAHSLYRSFLVYFLKD